MEMVSYLFMFLIHVHTYVLCLIYHGDGGDQLEDQKDLKTMCIRHKDDKDQRRETT